MDKVVGFSEQYVQIRYNHPAAESLVNFLCADLLVAQDMAKRVVSRASCEVRVAEDEQWFSLHRDQEQLYQGACQRELAYALVNEIIFQCLDENRNGLALHAGAVQVGQKGILLPGNSGSGKSTFVAWLTACGCQYLTDELVVLAGKEGRIVPFTRPLTLRPASEKALAPYIRLQASETLRGHTGFMVPHRQLNPDFSPSTPPLSLLLFPRFQPH
ncbi:MAG: hypothetical protein D3908_15900, partial [Candidatus Electrothrix sp. AUS4]|nr:hypothetical protein [Candidatus Electrothrix sp. AUS4]